MARCLLKSKGVLGEFWGEAVSTAVYLLNRAPTKSLKGRTPFEAWHNRKPKVHHLRTFGCIANVKVAGPGVSKMSDRSIKMVFVGYETRTKGYRVYDPISRKLHISRNVIFEESKGWDWKPHAQADPVTSVFDVEFYTVAGQGIVNNQQNAAAAEDLWEHESTLSLVLVQISPHHHRGVLLDKE
jgi:hypothetical protein